jgi:hypothetical protein
MARARAMRKFRASKQNKAEQSATLPEVFRPSNVTSYKAYNLTYEKRYCHLLVEHMAQGYTFESFGAVVNAGKRTLYEWVTKYPEFAQSKDLGYVKALLFWEQQGKQAFLNPRSYSPIVWIFRMKNQFSWKDVKEDDEVASGGSHASLTGNQLLELVKLARGEKEKEVITIPKKDG